MPPTAPSAPVRPAVAAASRPRLLLLGTPRFERAQRRTHPGWSYAKLPALLAVLAADGRKPVRREWLAALLWPERTPASLRRALFELRRELGEAPPLSPLLIASRQHLQLAPLMATDLDVVESAWRSTPAAGAAVLDVARANEAMALWRGEFAADLLLHDSDDFDLWLSQTRAHWEQRCVAIAVALVEHSLAHHETAAATAVARLAIDRAPLAEAARAAWWRCLAASGQPGLAAADWHGHTQHLRGLGLAPSAGLARSAAELGLEAGGAARAAAPAPPAEPGAQPLARRLADILRAGVDFTEAPSLLDPLQRTLATRALSVHDVALLRLGFTVRLHAAPWKEPMDELTGELERLLLQDLPLGDRLSLTWPLATYHGWMGRGLRGEVLLRGVAQALQWGQAKPAALAAYELALALCHSCSTGNPEVSLRAARRGLRLARSERLAGYLAPLHLVEANAAANLGDTAAAARALRSVARGDEPLRPVDLAHYHQIGAYLRLLQGRHAEALAEALTGAQIAARVGLPMQLMSCQMAGLAARAALDEEASGLARDFSTCLTLAQRIGADGYLMNLHFIDAVLCTRRGDASQGVAALARALTIARRCGVQRLRKLPPSLLGEALAAPLRSRLEPAQAEFAAGLAAALPPG